MAAQPQNPFLKRKSPFSAETLPGDVAGDTSAAAAPAAAPVLRRQNPLLDDGASGFRDVAKSVASGAKAFDSGMDRLTKQPQPIAWNLTPTRDRMGFPAVAYGSTPDARPTLQPMPRNLFRPRTGPGSVAELPAAATAPPIGSAAATASGPTAAAPVLPASVMGGAAAPRTAPADFSKVSSGVSTTAPVPVAPQTQKPGGTDVEGKDPITGKPRHLSYGAMVNGRPTYSDGTGGIARTMSDASIGQLAQERSISRADPGALGHALASDANGGGTVTQEQMIAQRVAQLQPPGSRPTDAMFAASDRNAIASRDPRSAAGIAARNLSVEAGFARTPRLRRMAEQALAQLATGTDQANLQGAQDQAALQRTQLAGDNALANTALAGQNQLADTRLQGTIRKPGQQTVDADGNVWMTDPASGLSTPVTAPDGKQLKQAVTRDDTATKRTNAIQDTLTKTANSLLVEYQKNQALLPPDQRQPADITQFREQAAKAAGLRIGTDPKTKRRVVEINGQVVAL